MGQTREKKISKAKQKNQLQVLTKSLSSGTSTPKSDFSKSSSLSDIYATTPTASEASSADQCSIGLTHHSKTPVETFSLLQSPIEVRHTTNRGQSVFTTRKIPAGALILSEHPILRLVSTDEITEAHKDSVLQHQIAQLPAPQRKAFRALHDTQKQNFCRDHSIWASNCYDLKRWSKDGGSCVGLVASRINHSCIPNVAFSFREDDDNGDGMMVFHAIKDIPKDKEVFSNYQSVFRVAELRQNEMQTHYGFTCDCRACMSEGYWGGSDGRRQEMIALMARVKKFEKAWVSGGGAMQCIEESVTALERVAELLIKESLMGVELTTVYKALAKWASRAGEKKRASEWMRKERMLCVVCFGEDSRRVEEIDARHGSSWEV